MDGTRDGEHPPEAPGSSSAEWPTAEDVGRTTEVFEAIGTTVTVCVSDPGGLSPATEVVRRAVDALDRAASRFRADSELVRLNASPGRPVAVSPLLLEAIGDALDAAEATDGLVDPSVGRALEILGYDRDFSEVAPTGPVPVRFARVPGWRGVRLDRARGTVTVPEGVVLDLGATAKARCADRAAASAAAAVASAGVRDDGVLVSMGGDLAVSGATPADGWVVRVTDRHDAPPDDPGITVAIRTGGMATSGTAARRWSRGGVELHHLVDPATGGPARSYWRTVSVCAATCLAANVASTASVILGESAPEWLTERALPARLVAEDGSVTVVCGWPLDTVS